MTTKRSIPSSAIRISGDVSGYLVGLPDGHGDGIQAPELKPSMDPCPFLRLLVGNLAMKFPASSNPRPPCFCKIELHTFPPQFASIPSQEQRSNFNSSSLAACFNLDKTVADEISRRNLGLKITLYRQVAGCGFEKGKFEGRISVPVDLGVVESRARVFHNGWAEIGGRKKKGSVELFASVRAEPDPRFVFEFDGETECSPQVYQVQGNVRQPVFTCKFGFRNSVDQNLRSRSMTEPCTSSWISSFCAKKEKPAKERKGWSVTIHDLSGSPVAAASMVTPFCPSPGSDRVSKSNPGAWLILRPGRCTWKPWGRLEAWRERGAAALSYRFDLLPDAADSTTTVSSAATTVAAATVNTKTGGKFSIDMTNSVTPVNSPQSSCDFGTGSWSGSETSSGFGSWPQFWSGGGFVMSSTVKKNSRPEVEVGVQQVTCTEDAAAFVALAAAIDLSMDACKSFSGSLRKELRQQEQ